MQGTSNFVYLKSHLAYFLSCSDSVLKITLYYHWATPFFVKKKKKGSQLSFLNLWRVISEAPFKISHLGSVLMSRAPAGPVTIACASGRGITEGIQVSGGTCWEGPASVGIPQLQSAAWQRATVKIKEEMRHDKMKRLTLHTSSKQSGVLKHNMCQLQSWDTANENINVQKLK